MTSFGALALPDDVYGVPKNNTLIPQYTLSGVCGPYGIWTTYCVLSVGVNEMT